ncbi:hypothetical protein KKB06_01250, partial [Patescibacteria group bacterium]|nr:hypothetical protein [Patescibacteria group bacterium]
MKFNHIAKKIKNKNITLFTTKDFQQITGLSQTGAWAALGRYQKQNLIKSPKKGLYYIDDTPPQQYLLANKLYSPSYISFETALSYYSIIPEVIYSITSATTKITREFKTVEKTFTYFKIKSQAFAGYQKKENYLIAEPEKALADYLYFVAL